VPAINTELHALGYTMSCASFRRASFLLVAVTIVASLGQSRARAAEKWLDTDVPAEQAICFVLYTVHADTLKLTAQLYPLDDGVGRDVQLQVDRDGMWETVAETRVSEEPYGWPQEEIKRWTAHFRVEPWDHSRNVRYRVVAADGAASLTGIIRKNPVEKKEIVIHEPTQARYQPVMKFKKTSDGYAVYRMTYSGHGGWSYPLHSDKLDTLARKYVRHVGTDEFFELR